MRLILGLGHRGAAPLPLDLTGKAALAHLQSSASLTLSQLVDHAA
jgi:hypothetical protein